MNRLQKRLLIEREADGTFIVRAPCVGCWAERVQPGALVGPGSPAGTLACLGRVFSLVLPPGCAGRVDRPAGARTIAVAYGQLLFRIVPLSGADDATDHDPRSEAQKAAAAAEGWSVVAPTAGVFYRRPTPEAPAFVETGTRIRAGQPIGLIEVMKTFNQILYGGEGQPEEAEVREIRCEDGEEVEAGQVLVVVR